MVKILCLFIHVMSSHFACSFQSSYPSWEPNSLGKRFLLELRTFREHKLQGQGIRNVCSPPRMWRGSSNLRGNRDRNNTLLRESPYTAGTGYQMGSLWLIDVEQKNHPYLLDWYYTSRYIQTADHRVDIPTVTYEVPEYRQGDYSMPSNFMQNEARYEQYWDHDDEARLQSHLGASTSTPVFQESVLQHHEPGNLLQPTRSAWWARSGPDNAQPQSSFVEPPDFEWRTRSGPDIARPHSSFLEPPDFNRNTAHTNYSDNLSERSLEEREQHLEWRNSRGLSRTTHADDLDLGDLYLHFDDVYSKPPETPVSIREPPNF